MSGRGGGGRCGAGEDDGHEEFVHQDSREDVASCEKEFPEGGVEPFVGREEDGEERCVAVRRSGVGTMEADKRVRPDSVRSNRITHLPTFTKLPNGPSARFPGEGWRVKRVASLKTW